MESSVAMGDHIPSDGQPANETRQRGDFEDGCVRRRSSDTRSFQFQTRHSSQTACRIFPLYLVLQSVPISLELSGTTKSYLGFLWYGQHVCVRLHRNIMGNSSPPLSVAPWVMCMSLDRGSPSPADLIQTNPVSGTHGVHWHTQALPSKGAIPATLCPSCPAAPFVVHWPGKSFWLPAPKGHRSGAECLLFFRFSIWRSIV